MKWSGFQNAKAFGMWQWLIGGEKDILFSTLLNKIRQLEINYLVGRLSKNTCGVPEVRNPKRVHQGSAPKLDGSGIAN